MLRLTLECGHYQLHCPEEDLTLETVVYVGEQAPRVCIYCRPSSHPPIVKVESVPTVQTREYWDQFRQAQADLSPEDPS